jgi:hypothetical protein
LVILRHRRRTRGPLKLHQIAVAQRVRQPLDRRKALLVLPSRKRRTLLEQTAQTLLRGIDALVDLIQRRLLAIMRLLQWWNTIRGPRALVQGRQASISVSARCCMRSACSRSRGAISRRRW